jgi:hypothetical protein
MEELSMRKNNKIVAKDWYDIEEDWSRMEQMSCKPSFQKLKVGTILDEDKSVRWNREQVEENNKKYQEEVARLNTLKNKAREQVYNDIAVNIQADIPGISIVAARKIFDYAYQEGHSYGINSIKTTLYEVIDLINVVLKNME